MTAARQTTRFRFWLWLIRFVGLIVPRRLRADWRQEWEAELRYREALLAEWERLDWHNKLDLLRRSTSAFWDALWLQPRRLEDEMFQDLRYGVRMLAKNPGFTLVAVLCLALGIGANTAIFGLVNAMLLRPLPGAAAPEQLVVVGRGNLQATPLSYPDFKVLRAGNEVLSGLALYTPMAFSFGHGTRSEVLLGALVSGDYFDVLGIKPVLGRTFLPAEDRTPGAHPVVVVSDSFWQSHFQRDPALPGQTIVLNGRRFTVIGVAPAGFDGTNLPVKVNLWMPMMMYQEAVRGGLGVPPDPLNDRRFERFDAVGRLKPGVSIGQAQAALETLNRQLEPAAPAPPEQRANPAEDRSLKLTRLQGSFYGGWRQMSETSAKLLAAVVFTLLLITCANVANLLLARATTRRKEIAVRLALGATRLRLLRQLLTESLLLALLGAVAGLVIAYWLNQLLMAFKPPFPPPFTFGFDLSLDLRTFGFTFLLALVTAVLFGLMPAWQTSRPDVVPALKDERGATGQRARSFNLRHTLVVAQVAMSLLLLVCAGLFLRSLRYAQQIELGFKPENVLTASFNLRLQGYDEARGREFYRQIVERLERLPGVQAVSVANFLPLGFAGRGTAVTPADRALPPNERPAASYFSVGTRYFETLGTPLLSGRDFTAQDNADSRPVVIISERLAQRLWPEFKDSREALGRHVRASQPNAPSCEVIGIVGDTKNSIFRPLDGPPQEALYRPLAQDYATLVSVALRTSGDPLASIPALRREVAALDENLPAQDLQPLTENISLALWSAHTGAVVLSVFGLLGLCLAVVGIYGVMSYMVAARTREIGVRMALGAERRDVLRLIVGQGLRLTLWGAGVGLALALLVTRVLRQFLFGIGATDPLTFVLIALLLTGVALVACYVPARRATKVDPLAALRHE
jgi:predicted permease